MPRVVSLFLPTWSTDRVRRKLGDAAPPAEAPLVLIGREGRRRKSVPVLLGRLDVFEGMEGLEGCSQWNFMPRSDMR